MHSFRILITRYSEWQSNNASRCTASADIMCATNLNNNNKRLPDIMNQENEFWSQPAQEAFYIPQPPSTLIPALPFTQTDDGLHDLPQDANWLFGDTGSEVDNIEVLETGDEDIDLYDDMLSPDTGSTDNSITDNDDIQHTLHSSIRNQSSMALETDDFVMETLEDIFWDVRSAILDSTEDGDDPDFDPLIETALNAIRNYDVIRASAQALLNDGLILDLVHSEEATHSGQDMEASSGGGSPNPGPSRWTRLPQISSNSSVSVASHVCRNEQHLSPAAMIGDRASDHAEDNGRAVITSDHYEHYEDTYSVDMLNQRQILDHQRYYTTSDHTYTIVPRLQEHSDTTLTGDTSGIDIVETMQVDNSSSDFKYANESTNATVNVNTDPGQSCTYHLLPGTVPSDHQETTDEKPQTKRSCSSVCNKRARTEIPKLPEAFTDTFKHIERWLQESDREDSDTDSDSLCSSDTELAHGTRYTVFRLSHSNVDVQNVSRKRKVFDCVCEVQETKSDSDLLVPYKRICL